MKQFIITTNKSKTFSYVVSKFIEQNIEYTTINSVIPEKYDSYFDCQVIKSGNAGLAIGHMMAIKAASQQMQKSNIFEDDEQIHENYLAIRDSLISQIDDDWDFINLNTFRPTGTPYNKYIFKVNSSYPKKTHGKYNNVWLSNYCISPKLAKFLYDNIPKDINFCRCFNNYVYDCFFASTMQDISSMFNIYVINQQNLLSIHSEAISIRKENNSI